MDDRTPGTPPSPQPEAGPPPRQDPVTTPSAQKKTGRRPPGAPAPPDLNVSIPGYTLEKRLGAGGMGDVYLARQASLDRLVAIKLLPPELAKDKTYVEHFLKEARSAARVTHENIMGAVDCGEANGRYYFVMEYVAGETLFKQIHKQQRIPEARALEITRQIARGLHHALQLGLIHRDIKPKNILITAEVTAKLCDFGLARDVSAAENQADEEFLHTTPAYASPEQCRGEAKLDHRSDVYSLGVTLYEMLTGRRPFQAATSRELMTKQVTEPAPAPKSVNPAISDAANLLVLRMLRKQPADRFKDYAELLGAIDKILGVSPSVAADPAARKKKMVLIGGAAAVGLIAIVLAIVLGSGGKKDLPPPPPQPAKAATIDPEIQRLLDEAAAFQAGAEGNPSEYAAVSDKWKKLEERYRGTPNSVHFAARRVDFEGKVSKEAEARATEVLTEAAGAQAGGRPGDALRALKKFPSEFSGTAAGSRVAAKELELARAIDGKFSTGMQGVSAALSAGRLDEAASQLNALKASMALDASNRPEFEKQIEQMRGRIAEESAMAKKKTETPQPAPGPAVVAEPRPDPKNPVPPGPAPDPAPRSGKSAKGVKPAVPPPAVTAQLAILASADRTDPVKRSESAAFFAVNAPKSAFFRATAYFLSKDEKDWKVDGPVKAALDEYFATPELALAETLTPEQEAPILAALAQKIAACGNVPADALQFFACAHLDDLVTRKGKPDPQVLAQAGLLRAGATDLWGPPASLARIEMARFLVRAPGLWIARAAEASATANDFPTRVLGTLCVTKDAAFDALQASDRWRKLGVGAPDPAWTKACDTLAERFKLSTACEVCLGQGKFPCATCNAQGATFCPTCKGAGKVLDPADGGKVTCLGCKGRGGATCATCNGQKNLKCANCDGKKSKPGLAGGGYRWLSDLGLCDPCEGEGSLFKSVAWPCPVCDGNGRLFDKFLKEFARMPAWIRTREGRSLFNALRWLARHQSPDGSWGTTGWSAACKEPGCVAPAGGRAADFDIGVTCLALTAFVSAGLGPESDLELGHVTAGSVIRRAIGWILSQQQPDGMIAHGGGKGAGSIKPVYENLLATYALFTAANSITPSEAFSDKDKQSLKENAFKALRAALALQNKGAGWGYTPLAPSDSWVTSWGAAALLAARDGGVDVPRVNLDWITAWYSTCTDKKDFHLGYAPAQMGKVNLAGNEVYLHHDTLSAFGGLMRMQIEGKASATVATADKLVSMDLPNPDPLRRDFCYWYLGTTFQAQREQRKGTGWKTWSEAAVRESITLQQSADTCSLGSWLPDDRWSLMGGKVYATAINALLMEQIQALSPAKAAKTK